MKRIGAFFRLVRWPNLVFILLTQLLFAYCIMQPIFAVAGVTPNLQGTNLLLLCLSYACIAGAGNIINDYFDVNIDLINKPRKVIIGKYIHRHWAIACHTTLSVGGIAIGFYLDSTTSIHLLGLWNIVCVSLLFLYSILLKRKPVSGNVLVAILCAWSILVITWSESVPMIQNRQVLNTGKISRFTFLYAGFAFVITLVREVIKDMEDIEGDRKLGCRTMPIVWGMNAAKVFVAVWLVVIIGILAIVQFYVLQFHWFSSAAYCIVLIIAPLVYIFRLLLQANGPKDYHKISSLVKWVMLTGILSMVFIRWGI